MDSCLYPATSCHTSTVGEYKMSIKSYILDGESVQSHTSSPFWTWICTDQRFIKYRSGNGTREDFHDISLSEISGITYENKGRKDGLLGYGLITGAVTFILFILASSYDENDLRIWAVHTATRRILPIPVVELGQLLSRVQREWPHQ